MEQHLDEARPPPSPQPTLLEALSRYAAVVIIPTVALVAAAVALAATREPTYKATAQLNVGQASITTQAIPGFTQAAESLASAYSRITSSRVIATPVARRTGLTVAQVSGRLSATPVSGSSVFRVNAEGPTEREAIALSRAGTREIQAYVKRLGVTESESRALLEQYRDAARETQRLDREIEDVRLEEGLEEGDSSPRVEDLEVQVSAARLREETVAQRYRESLPTAPGGTVQVLDLPTAASSDRLTTLQRFTFVGLVGGLLVGAALAVWLANRSWRRRARGY